MSVAVRPYISPQGEICALALLAALFRYDNIGRLVLHFVCLMDLQDLLRWNVIQIFMTHLGES